jgi:hypothetical protein
VSKIRLKPEMNFFCKKKNEKSLWNENFKKF